MYVPTTQLTQSSPTWTPWTPTLEAVTTSPTLGSGSSVVGSYCQIGDYTVARFGVIFGSSGVSAGSGVYFVAAPTPIHADSQRFAGSGFAFISGSGRTTICDLDVANDRIQFWTDNTASNVAHNVPATWVANAQLHADVIYRTG